MRVCAGTVNFGLLWNFVTFGAGNHVIDAGEGDVTGAFLESPLS